MKKLFAAILALCLLASLSVTAFASSAEPTIDQNSTDKTGKLEVTYEVAPTYTVTIPASVTGGGEATVTASDVVVEKDQHVEVKLTGTSGTGNAFTLKTEEGAEITYKVIKDQTEVSVGGTILTVKPGDTPSGSTTLTFEMPEEIQYAGTYTGTITFTVSVENNS